ncbi:uncharacterized protein V6R79_025701 [Siganus canaliculatus]
MQSSDAEQRSAPRSETVHPPTASQQHEEVSHTPSHLHIQFPQRPSTQAEASSPTEAPTESPTSPLDAHRADEEEDEEEEEEEKWSPGSRFITASTEREGGGGTEPEEDEGGEERQR